MTTPDKDKPQRVLIASSHPLFGQGLRRLLESRRRTVEVVGMASSIDETMQSLAALNPDLIIVDYDDEQLNRDEFLARFVEGERKLRVVLLSLSDAQQAVVYDRRTMEASRIDDWLEDSTFMSMEETPVEPGLPAGLTRPNRRSSMKHFIIAGILVVLMTALIVFGAGQVRLLPIAASLQAQPIDRMFTLEFLVIAFLFSLILVFLVYSIFVFRRKKGDMTDAPHIDGNPRLEIVWTVIPLITVLGFAFMGSQALAETQRVDPDALVVDAIGSQWSWRFDYPALGISSTELRLPVDRQVLLRLSSMDVIHSFWVPEFRVKQDALPGGKEFVRQLRITPTTVGEYKVRCAELCGLNHYSMEAPVIVMAKADYEAWAAEEAGLSANPADRGQKWYETFGCRACHSIDGSPLVGPSWKGLYGSERKFSDGSTATVDDAYLIEAIRNPGVKVVDGFQDLMPAAIAGSMTDAQIQDVIEFIKSLK
jgi:cytochrome c oxidase subunit 2